MTPFLIEVAIEPKDPVRRDALVAALAELAAGDSSLDFALDDESRQVLLKGVSEEQLDAAVSRLKSEFDLIIGRPQVAYRERLTTKRVEIDYTHKKQTFGSGQFARVKIVFEPVAIGAGSSFQAMIAAGSVPAEFIPSVEKGVSSAMSSGVVAGFPVVDVKTTLIDGAYHETDSSELAFEIAARSAAREALHDRSELIEPIMKIDVVTPEEHIGFVIGDLRSRRGQSLNHVRNDDNIIVSALVPLASMFGYGSSLRAGTRGRAKFTMSFSHYAPLPPSGGGDDLFPPVVGMRA